MRRVLLPVVALLLAGSTTLMARSWMAAHAVASLPTPPPAPVRPQTKSVLVAAEDLGTGQFLRPNLLRWQEWPDVDLPAAYVVAGAGSIDSFVGTVVRRPVGAGQPLLRGAVVSPGERGFLAAVLDPGMRAVSVAIDDTSGNAGLIFPGDRVDLILTRTIAGQGDGAADRRLAETVLEDLRVIAMGRRLAADGRDDGQARTATFEVTPAQAEKVALLTDLGRLALSLRSLASATTALASPPTGGTWDSDVTHGARRSSRPAPAASVLILRGQATQALSLAHGEHP